MENKKFTLKINNIEYLKEKNIDLTDTNFSSKNRFKNIIKNKKNKYHLLPQYNEIPSLVLDFEDINSKNFNDLEDGYIRIATVTPPFLKNIQGRFSIYYSR